MLLNHMANCCLVYGLTTGAWAKFYMHSRHIREGISVKITQIKQVLEVAKVGSISQAAMNLYITQPNLSQSIRKLEEEIGTPIFQRTNTGVALTSFGSRFVSGANEVMMHMALLDDLCSTQTEARPMELSVASGGYLFVTRQIAELFEKYSGNPIQINYYEASGRRQIELLRNNKVDLGFLSCWSYDRKAQMKRLRSADIEYHHLADATPGIYVDIENPWFSEADTVVDLEKIRNLPYVTTHGAQGDTQIASMFRQIYPDIDLKSLTCVTRTIRVENSATMRDMLTVTKGFALGSYCNELYDRSGFYDKIRFIPFEKGLVGCEVGWLQRNNSTRTVLADELINSLRSRIG